MSQSRLYEYLQKNSPELIIVKDHKEALASADLARFFGKDVLEDIIYVIDKYSEKYGLGQAGRAAIGSIQSYTGRSTATCQADVWSDDILDGPAPRANWDAT